MHMDRKQLACPVCAARYDSKAHRPILLPCCHTLCKHCITALSSQRCPECSTDIGRPREDLPTNVLVEQAMAASYNPLEQLVRESSLEERAASLIIPADQVQLGWRINGGGGGDSPSETWTAIYRGARVSCCGASTICFRDSVVM